MINNPRPGDSPKRKREVSIGKRTHTKRRRTKPENNNAENNNAENETANKTNESEDSVLSTDTNGDNGHLNNTIVEEPLEEQNQTPIDLENESNLNGMNELSLDQNVTEEVDKNNDNNNKEIETTKSTEVIPPNILMEGISFYNAFSINDDINKGVVLMDIPNGSKEEIDNLIGFNIERRILKALFDQKRISSIDVSELFSLLYYDLSITYDHIATRESNHQPIRSFMKSYYENHLHGIETATNNKAEYSNMSIRLDKAKPLAPKKLVYDIMEDLISTWNIFYNKILSLLIVISSINPLIIKEILGISIVFYMLYIDSPYSLITCFLAHIHSISEGMKKKSSPYKMILTCRDYDNHNPTFIMAYKGQDNNIQSKLDGWKINHRNTYNKYYSNNMIRINTRTNTTSFELFRSGTSNDNDDIYTNNNNKGQQTRTIPISFGQITLPPLDDNSTHLRILYSLEMLLKYPELSIIPGSRRLDIETSFKDRLCSQRKQYKFLSKELSNQVPTMASSFKGTQIYRRLIGHFLEMESILLRYFISITNFQKRDENIKDHVNSNLGETITKRFADKRYRDAWKRPSGTFRVSAEVYCSLMRLKIFNKLSQKMIWEIKPGYLLFSDGKTQWQIKGSDLTVLPYITEEAANETVVISNSLNNSFIRERLPPIYIRKIDYNMVRRNVSSLTNKFLLPLREFIGFWNELMEYDISSSISLFLSYLQMEWSISHTLPFTVFNTQTPFEDINIIEKITYCLFHYFGQLKILYDITDIVEWKNVNNFHIRECFLGIVNKTYTKNRFYILIMKNNHSIGGCKIYKITIEYSIPGALLSIYKQLCFNKAANTRIKITAENMNKMLTKVIRAYTTTKWI